VRISRETLVAQAEATGFRPDVLEKVALLLGLLNALSSHPFLKGKLALKGGTALNMFVFDVPRLSVDIDLNYVGAENRTTAEKTNK
jgi:predicted nucleotidyltransferase component of viral defense system